MLLVTVHALTSVLKEYTSPTSLTTTCPRLDEATARAKAMV
uniref:Uncharacterized protein n=1 Tax=Anguilla anguilla TaxID=7936 RepID=A0A0E9UAZ1_ANGAN